MKKKKDSNPFLALWQKIILDGRIDDIAQKYRLQINLPKDGCRELEKYEKWYTEHIGQNDTLEQRRRTVCQKFCDEIVNKLPTHYYVDRQDFNSSLIQFFLLGNLDWEKITEEGASTMFSILLVNESKDFFSSKKMEDGIYIKIGPHSSIQNIQKFLSKKSSLIKSYQDAFLRIKKSPQGLKLYSSKNQGRDEFIQHLSETTRLERIELGAKKDYKEEQIAYLMKKVGCKNMTAEKVKIILHRRRKAKNSFLK